MVYSIKSIKVHLRKHRAPRHEEDRNGMIQPIAIHLVDEGGRARDELDVVAVEDELILDLLGAQDGHTLKHVHLPDLRMIEGPSNQPVRATHGMTSSDLVRRRNE